MPGTKSYTDDEIKAIKEQAVLVAEVGDLKATIPEIFAAIKAQNKALTAIPIQITECRDDMDREIKNYMHGRFLTEADLRKFERQVEIKVDKVSDQVNRATWIVSGFISAGIFIMWVMKYTDLFVHMHGG